MECLYKLITHCLELIASMNSANKIDEYIISYVINLDLFWNDHALEASWGSDVKYETFWVPLWLSVWEFGGRLGSS